MHDQATIKSPKDAPRWLQIARSLAGTMEKMVPDVEISTLHRNLVSRIINSDSAKWQLNWVYQLVSYWTKSDPRLGCELKYPIISKMVYASPTRAEKKLVIPVVLQAVDDYLPGLLETDYDCGASLLELESEVLRGNIDSFTKRWIVRTKWPMVQQVVKHLWLASETMYENGRENSAREIWRHLTDKASQEFPEVKFSQIRLDPKRTEFEGLWK
jgi:hypothetical protein